MIVEIFFSVTAAAVLTVVGSLWINGLYRTSTELTFPKKIYARARFRVPILFVALTFLFVKISSTPVPEIFFTAAAIWLLALMTVTDFEQYMLFDAMTLPLAIIGGFFSWHAGANFFDVTGAAIIGGGFFLLLAVVTGALGGGDVKLIAALGLWLGCEKLLSVVLIGSIAGGVAALLMILTRKKDRRSYFAYGPYFTLAAIYVLLT